MNTSDQLIKELLRIENELESLNNEYSNLYKQYTGNDFTEQNMLAEDTLDNLIIAATHEAATGIGFFRHSIVELIKFIGFRKRYHDYSDHDLHKIIDEPDVSIKERISLSDRSDKRNLSDLEEIRKTWNELFMNKSYAKVKVRLKLS